MSNIDYLQSDNSKTRGGPTLGEFLNKGRFDALGFRSLSPEQIDVAISSEFGLDAGLFGEYSRKGEPVKSFMKATHLTGPRIPMIQALSFLELIRETRVDALDYELFLHNLALHAQLRKTQLEVSTAFS